MADHLINDGIINYPYEKKFELKIKGGKIMQVAYLQYALY